jgi:class 3 adenylate cyclase
MLPRNVALQLRSGENVVAEEFHNISLLYSDIVSFTEYSASSTPDRVVQLLSQLFTAFDRLNDVHNVYKVQTIGDAYVCCAGLPFLRQGTAAEHAKNCIRMGMAMLREINTVRTVEGGKVQMRIGIHVGTIVAGVVGTKKLRYDIWGLDAMVANACESNSQAGCILLSGEAAALVEDDFDLQPSVQFEVVGKKAPIKTFLLDPSKQLLAPIRAGTLESQGSTGILFSEH